MTRAAKLLKNSLVHLRKTKIIFIGAGAYSKSVLDSLSLYSQYEFVGFIDNFKKVGSMHLGYPILANTLSGLKNKHDYKYFVTIGNNEYRTKNYQLLLENNCDLISIIDKSAMVAADVSIGKGVFVGKLALINRGVQIGDNVIINTKSLIEHGCVIGNHCNISTNTVLNGDVIVEDFCFVGSTSCVIGQLKIGKKSIIGAGAVVIRDVKPFCIVAGVPAKLIRKVEV